MAIGWDITGQEQTREINSQGAFDDFMRVSFKVIPENVAGNVLIPMNYYNEEYVRSLIEERVKAIKAVHAL